VIELRPYSDADLPLLIALNAPELKTHVGGPETDEQVRRRHEKYVAATETAHMFTIVVDGEAAGSIGYWDKTWRDAPIYETGWAVLTHFQGRGIATAATRAIVDLARAERTHRSLHAFPGVDNPASNAICRKAGFTLIGECEFEYPPGHLMRCNDWRIEL
jgi:RimJ/RimL family protein N-acetyltransferase